MQAKPCYNCNRPATKDVVALNKKLLGLDTKRVLCISCLAEYFNCTEDELENSIEEFKMQGCTLFT